MHREAESTCDHTHRQNLHVTTHGEKQSTLFPFMMDSTHEKPHACHGDTTPNPLGSTLTHVYLSVTSITLCI